MRMEKKNQKVTIERYRRRKKERRNLLLIPDRISREY